MTVDHAYHCDDIFEILTSGPFPRGAEGDESVERHIASCHECRRLAEAMRPATNLFHETLSESESANLPRYEGFAAAPWHDATPLNLDPNDSTKLDSVASGQVSSVPRHQSRRVKSHLIFWPLLVAAGLFGVGLSMGVEWMHRSNGNERPLSNLGSFEGEPQSDGIPDAHGERFLVSLELPSHCFSISSRRGAAVDDMASQDSTACCTECHSGSAEHPRKHDAARESNHKRMIGRLIGSCGACHIRS